MASASSINGDIDLITGTIGNTTTNLTVGILKLIIGTNVKNVGKPGKFNI